MELLELHREWNALLEMEQLAFEGRCSLLPAFYRRKMELRELILAPQPVG